MCQEYHSMGLKFDAIVIGSRDIPKRQLYISVDLPSLSTMPLT